MVHGMTLRCVRWRATLRGWEGTYSILVPKAPIIEAFLRVGTCKSHRTKIGNPTRTKSIMTSNTPIAFQNADCDRQRETREKRSFSQGKGNAR